MAKLFVCGEALIDFVPCRSDDGSYAFQPKTGGSPYNAARAASLAGADVSFIGALSTDLFGEQLEADLKEAGVDCSNAPKSDDPTTLAFVDMSQGSPRYAFFNNGTATRNTVPPAQGFSPQLLDILDVGSISLIDEPGADNIADFCKHMAGNVRISIDPNARPEMTKDKPAWQNRIEGILAIATIIKISDEDLDYMYPGLSAEDFAAQSLSEQTQLVVVTMGGDGASAFTKSGQASVKPPSIEVADTVGAGDALMGAMLAWLLEHCSTIEVTINSLTDHQLTDLLNFSTTGAAINCTRVGAAPPTKAEIKEWVRS